MRHGLGARLPRTDARAKVTGAFTYSSDLAAEDMLFGATLRSPHPSARIVAIDTAAARAMAGVHAVLTAADLPAAPRVGAIVPDQPILATDVVRYDGEPVAIVAAADAATARRAAAAIVVDYAPRAPLDSVTAALADGAPALHPGGNALRTVRVVHGDPGAAGPVVVRGTYAIGRQDQAFLGPESGLAIPHGRGRMELHVATQWLHGDRDQVADGLGVAPEQVIVHLAGVGGAFGGREDLSVHLHACLLARATGRPVKMVYLREESFVGHVHRHPATLEYEHHAREDGTLVAVHARLLFDGGAYASTSPAVIANATTLAAGPYRVPNALLEGTVAYTNNPPSGAMRGFGAPQVAIAYEAQMDRLAAATGLDPLEVRRRNALRDDDELPFGQRVGGPVATTELLDRLAALPLPGPADPPGGAFATTRGEDVRRGVGYAAGFKNIAFSEGEDDFASASVRLALRDDGTPYAEVHSAAAEVGQGVAGVQEQLVREELGVADVRVLRADTHITSAGSASASRLTWMISGAVQAACAGVRDALLERAAALVGVGAASAPLALRGGVVTGPGGTLALEGLLLRGPVEAVRTFRHRPTHALDPTTGRGDVHVAFAFVAHRAVVDVDLATGATRVVELACAQDVGRAVNPLALEGQLEGGSVQGLGLALTEDLRAPGAVVATRSFGTYRIPTFADAPSLPSVIVEHPHPDSPYGVTGVGEMPSISSTPAVLAALRAATGRPLTRVPALPEDLIA